MKLFLSYGHDEHAGLVRRVKADLEGEGFEVWLDEQAIRSSQDWEHSIEKGIAGADAVVAFLTPHAMRRPDGVCLDELAHARFQGKPITPVMVQFVQPPLSISRIQWLDMRNWRDPATGEINETWYRERFGQLLAAIRGEYKLGFEGEQSRLRAILKPLEYGAEIDRHVRGFCGRGWVFEAFDAWLAGEGGSRVFWITGPAGVGKSALAALLAHGRPAVAGIHFCRHGDSDRADPRKAICSLAYQLATQLPDYQHALLALPELDELAGKNASALFNTLLVEPLRGLGPQTGRRVLVIDALDEAEHDGKNDLVGLIGREAKQLPAWLGLVITSRPEPEILRKLSSLKPYRLEASDANNQADLRAYLTRELGAKLIGPVGERALGVLLERSEGNFLYATQVLEAIRAGTLELARPEGFPTGLTGVYQHFFERQFGDEADYKKRVRPLLEVVLAAREPLPVELAAEALSWDEYERDEVLAALGSLFPVRDEAIAPFHKSVADWLEDREKSGPYRASAIKGHERLAETLWATYARDPGLLPLYGLRHLPGHLAAAGRGDDVEGLLTGFDFPMVKVAVGLINELITDYVEASEARSTSDAIRIWRDFLRRNAHVLRRGTGDWPANRILLQLAWEHADDSPVTLAAEQWLEQGKCTWHWLRRVVRPAGMNDHEPIAVLDRGLGARKKRRSLIPGNRILVRERNSDSVWDGEHGRLLTTRPSISGHLLQRSGLLLGKSGDVSAEDEPEPCEIVQVVFDAATGEIRSRVSLPNPTLGSRPTPLCVHLINLMHMTVLGDWTAIAEPASGVLLIGTEAGTLEAWDPGKGVKLWEVEPHDGWPVGGFYVLGNGRVCSFPIMLPFDLEQERRLAEEPCEDVPRVWLDPDRELEKAHASRAAFKIWDLASGELVNVIEAPALRDWRFSRIVRLDRSRILVWDNRNGDLEEIDLETGVLGASMSVGSRKETCVWRVSDRLVASSANICPSVVAPREIAIWDSRTGTIAHRLIGRSRLPENFASMSRGRLLSWEATGTSVWDLETGQVVFQLSGVQPWILPDGAILLLIAGERTPRLLAGELACSTIPEEELALSVLPFFQESPAPDVLPLANGRVLVDDTLWLIDHLPRCTWEELAAWLPARLEETIRPVERSEPAETEVWFGPIDLLDGRALDWVDSQSFHDVFDGLLTDLDCGRQTLLTPESAFDPNVIYVVDRSTGKQLAEWRGHSSRVLGAGRVGEDCVCSWAADCTLRLWDSKTGRSRAVLDGQTRKPTAIGYLEDGTIISCAEDGVRSWTGEGSPVTVLRGENLSLDLVSVDSQIVHPCREVPGGRVVVGDSQNSRIHLFKPRTGEVETIRGENCQPLGDRFLLIRCADSDVDGPDGWVEVLDQVTLKPVARVSGKVADAKVLSDRRLVLTLEDGSVALIDATTTTALQTVQFDAPIEWVKPASGEAIFLKTGSGVWRLESSGERAGPIRSLDSSSATAIRWEQEAIRVGGTARSHAGGFFAVPHATPERRLGHRSKAEQSHSSIDLGYADGLDVWRATWHNPESITFSGVDGSGRVRVREAGLDVELEWIGPMRGASGPSGGQQTQRADLTEHAGSSI